jgi:hypothetical protein
MQSTTQFKVDFVGEESGTRYQGFFTARVKASHLDTLRQDEIRRTTLGAGGDAASIQAQNLAHAYAFCVVRLLNTKDVPMPPWFKESNYGLESEDGNMLVEVNNACFAAIEKARGTTVNEAEAALKALRAKGDGDGAPPSAPPQP